MTNIVSKTPALKGAAVPFAPGDSVVYPGHGVGRVSSIETQSIGGQDIKLFVIAFEQDRMTLRVPFHKVKTSGLRSVSTPDVMKAALTALKGPGSQKRVMWNRRALEYTAKINSGDVVALAEVVRDLYRPVGQPERSHSERLIYEQALGRLTHEMAAVEQTGIEAATTKLDRLLNAA